jgi:hypothetical protein
MGADLELVLRWTKSRPLVLMGVDVRRGSEPWRPLLAKPIAENDGALAIPLGFQDPGRLTLKFAVVALAEIPRIAAYAVNGGAGAVKISPADAHAFKRLRRYDRWVQQARYDVTPPAA